LKNRRVFLWLFLVAVIGAVGCSGGDGMDPILYYTTISNNWVDASNSDHDFQLSSTDDGKTVGSFTGTEHLSGVDVGDVTGGWADNVVTMTVDRSGVVTTYHADLAANSPNQLVFRAGSETLTLNRN
jgi:hypothetical protein